MARCLVLLLAFVLLCSALVIVPQDARAEDGGIARVGVSGTSWTLDGTATDTVFMGQVETTLLMFQILAYIEGETIYAGHNSHLDAPDTTSGGGVLGYHADLDEVFSQYFAITAGYDMNLVRIGPGDSWGSQIMYEAWLNHNAAFDSLLHTMCDAAERRGVWLCLVLAGSQGTAAYQFGGSGHVFDTGSSAYSNYIAYATDVMEELEEEDSIAMYDLFNEPDHDWQYSNYWNTHGDEAGFQTWASKVANDTDSVSTHPRTMGVGGLGGFFEWGYEDFMKCTGSPGFEIAHRHYYASAQDTYLFTDPEAWSYNAGKPLYWGELAKNDVYPLVRWTWAENTIMAAGGQAIAPMVLTGTSGYPYTGGLIAEPENGTVTPPAGTDPTPGLPSDIVPNESLAIIILGSGGVFMISVAAMMRSSRRRGY